MIRRYSWLQTRPTYRSSTLFGAPNVLRHFHDQSQLLTLIIDCHRVADVVARKAALRAESKLIQRRIFGGEIDTALEVVMIFKDWILGCNEPKNDMLAFRKKP